MKVLITGADGQLGRCLLDRVYSYDFISEVIACNKESLDITDISDVVGVLTQNAPDIVVNAAGYTAVDDAEDDKVSAFLVNYEGPRNLAVTCEKLSIPLIHVSTDYVFDGTASKAYKEEDTPCPIGIYGMSKYEGEKAVIRNCSQSLVIRTSWVFSEYGNNFLKTMIRLASNRDEIKVVSDQIGCPTYAGDIATAIIKLCKMIGSCKSFKYGIYHYSGDIAVSWYEFARQIFIAADEFKLASPNSLKAINSKEYITKANRPNFSVLDNEKINRLDVNSSNWYCSLRYIVPLLFRDLN